MRQVLPLHGATGDDSLGDSTGGDYPNNEQTDVRVRNTYQSSGNVMHEGSISHDRDYVDSTSETQRYRKPNE